MAKVSGRAVTLALVATAFSVGCAAERESWTSPPSRMAAYPPNQTGQHPGYQQPGQPQAQPVNQPGAQSPQPAQTFPAIIGTAMNGFSTAVQGLPDLFSTIPASLPSIPWPFPWGQPSQPQPNPQPQPNTGPEPNPQPSNPLPSTGDSWPADWIAFEDQVLTLTNAERARGAVCGDKQMQPVGPLVANPQLRTAARLHSQDMGRRGYFEHDNPEGMGPGARAQAAGFKSKFVGENIAAGQPTPEAVVAAWMKSPGHCLNIMEAGYRTLGVGYSFDSNAQYGHYWTQDFGD